MTESESVVLEVSPEEIDTPTAAQRARAERNRLRARQLQDARPLARSQRAGTAAGTAPAPRDTGGGFLLEEEPAPARPPAPQPAPAHGPERPRCLSCGERFALSHLHSTFGWAACDSCRDDEGEHALVTRTEAKAEFLLQDCDLDSRPPPLRCETRRNPHRGGAPMRLYLRAAVQQRAHDVWGGADGLRAERERRAARQEAKAERARAARLRALRLAARSTLLRRETTAHHHRWGLERHMGEDQYCRECEDCGLRETYEKM